MRGYSLGRVLGIDLRVHASWLVIAGLVFWSLATTALPADFPALQGAARLVMAAAITLLFFLSLLAHELAHSVAAMARGIPVRRITFFLFGGMAETSKESRSPGEEFVIAVAGPVCSLLLAALFFAVFRLGGDGWSPAVAGTALYLAILNLVLALFNLLPGFPMDGGRILRAVLWKTTGSALKATHWASRIGVGMAVLLMAYGAWIAFAGDVIGGLWMVMIGLFIRAAARSGYQQHLLSRVRPRMAPAAARESTLDPDDAAPRARPGGWTHASPPPRRPAGYPPLAGRDVTDLGRHGS